VDGHRRSVRPTQRAAHGGVLTGRAAARAARREPRHRARHRLHTHSPLPPAPPLAATPGCPSHARPHVAVAPAEVPRFEAGVAQHTRQVGGQQPRAGPLGGVDNVVGHGALVPLVKEPDRRPQPGIRVVPTPNADSAAAARQSCRPVRPSAGRTPPRSAQRPPANRQAAVHRRAGTPQRARPSTPTPTAGGRAHGNPRSANRACAAAVAAAAGPSAQVRRRARSGSCTNSWRQSIATQARAVSAKSAASAGLIRPSAGRTRRRPKDVAPPPGAQPNHLPLGGLAHPDDPVPEPARLLRTATLQVLGEGIRAVNRTRALRGIPACQAEADRQDGVCLDLRPAPGSYAGVTTAVTAFAGEMTHRAGVGRHTRRDREVLRQVATWPGPTATRIRSTTAHSALLSG
jgi:hypothetical protein